MEYKNWDLSWSKTAKAFRWIEEAEPDNLLYCTSAEGEMDMLGTKNETGRLIVFAGLEVTEKGHAWVFADPNREPEQPPADAEHLFTGYCRMCFDRSHQRWRARDELGSKKVTFVQTYHGRVKLYWYDKASHIFHGHPDRLDGTVYLKDNEAYLT